ncbi:metal-dependent hydrolase [Sinimarinibacterium thermocellulolyticum]|uniref:Metal-dependent hydrolase n=1 Tax=Sinimarinibacterium thermocellulolyticum TaxID=3170016 RepID=A0ABV2A7Z1_9GAMM
MKPSKVTHLTAKAQSPVLPTRRDIRFDLPAEHIADWNKGSVHLSQFMNTLSIFFPVGERFFIDAVRQYRDQITDPELQKAVTAFIGQEAMHGREHEEYNALLFARVPEAAQVERFVFALLENVKKLPPRMRLSATIALEHFTAIMADGLLGDERLLDGAEPHFARLWRWHALEETEHKAVAFDVWDTVMGRGTAAYLERSAGMVLATVIFWSIMIPAYLAVIRREGKLTDLKGWRYFFQQSFTKVPFFPGLLRPYLDYFRRDFHPWDHDNRHFLEQIDGTLGELRAAA